MSLNEDLILTIELENQDEIEKVMDNLQKKVSKTSSGGKAKSDKKVEIKQEYDLWKANAERLKLKESEARFLNKRNKIMGISNKEYAVELDYMKGESEFYKIINKDKDENASASDREGAKLDKLIRKYRWLQSFLLVTQNFIGMIGKSVKAFGAGMKLLTAPFVLFLNLVLIPVLPLLADFSKWLMDIKSGQKKMNCWRSLLAVPYLLHFLD